MESLEHRLASLERANRRWRTCCAAIAIPLGLLFFLSANGNDDQVFERIKAKQFVIVNDQGESRGGFHWDEKTDSGFFGLKAGDKPIAIIALAPEERSPNGATFILFNRKGKNAIVAGSSPSGGVIDIFNSGERRVVSAQANNFGQGMVATFLRNGEPGEALANAP